MWNHVLKKYIYQVFYALTVININKECLVSPDSEIITVIIPSHYYENNFIRVFFCQVCFLTHAYKNKHTNGI